MFATLPRRSFTAIMNISTVTRRLHAAAVYTILNRKQIDRTFDSHKMIYDDDSTERFCEDNKAQFQQINS